MLTNYPTKRAQVAQRQRDLLDDAEYRRRARRASERPQGWLGARHWAQNSRSRPVHHSTPRALLRGVVAGVSVSGGKGLDGPAAQYDAVADSYARLVAPRYAPIAALLHTAIGPVAPRSSVVEFAAGTGALTRLVAPRVLAQDGDYIAVDISAGCFAKRAASWIRGFGSSSPTVTPPAWDLECRPVAWLPSGCFRTPTRDGARPLGCCAPPRPRGVDHVGVAYAERDLIADVRRLLGAPALPATPVDDVLARAARAGFGSLRHQDVRLSVVHDSIQGYLQYRSALGVPPWVPPGRETDAVDAITAAAESYVNQDGQVVLDWNVSVLEARSTTPPATAHKIAVRGKIRESSRRRLLSNVARCALPRAVKPPSGRWSSAMGAPIGIDRFLHVKVSRHRRRTYRLRSSRTPVPSR